MLLRILAVIASFSTALAVYTCEPHESAAFVRVSRARLLADPVVISTGGDDLNCATYCRNNVEPTTGAQRACAAYNYDGRETCYFFDNAATPAGSATLAPNAGANNFYYEKVCLPGISEHQACAFRSHTFERLRSAHLEGYVTKSMQVDTRDECLSACLREETFVCRSANYNYNTRFCELSTEDRRSKPNYMRLAAEQPIDYFDNNCLTRQNRCGEVGGNLIFVKTSQFEIHGYDHTSSLEAQESSCLQKCLDSLNTFCRSVEFAPTLKKCIISDEDTFSRADQQGKPNRNDLRKDYYEPVCVAADLTSSTCRQQAAFERFIGQTLQAQPIASAQGVTVSDCISLCFQNLDCKSINFDRTKLACYVYKIGRAEGNIVNNPSMDYYEFNCESQFGGMALCTPDGIRFIINTKEPYTGAIYAAERFGTCNQVVSNAKQIHMTFPPPGADKDCGTVLKDGTLEALVVVSLDGIMPHQVTTEWDRFYRITCDTSMKGINEGGVIVTTLFDAQEPETVILPSATPAPVTASLQFLDAASESPLTQASIGDPMLLEVKSEQAGPDNMMIMDCTAVRMGGQGDSVPFKVIENGCPRYPALVGAIEKDFEKRRLTATMKAFRLDGSFDIEVTCSVMFCATPDGCPPSNCLDSGNQNLFQSYGRKKRSALSHYSTNFNATNQIVEEKLSTIIRVLAEGEIEEDIEDAAGPPFLSVGAQKSTKGNVDDLLCVAESAFIAIVVATSILCLMFSAVIFSWACRSGKKVQGGV